MHEPAIGGTQSILHTIEVRAERQAGGYHVGSHTQPAQPSRSIGRVVLVRYDVG